MYAKDTFSIHTRKQCMLQHTQHIGLSTAYELHHITYSYQTWKQSVFMIFVNSLILSILVMLPGVT